MLWLVDFCEREAGEERRPAVWLVRVAAGGFFGVGGEVKVTREVPKIGWLFEEAAAYSLDLSVLYCGFIRASEKAEVGDRDLGPVGFVG